MRSYKFVVQITPDFDDLQYRIRAIDFDQQFYEGNPKLYMPQYFKDNLAYVQLCMEHLTDRTALQYQQEERASIVHRVGSERHRIAAPRDVANTGELPATETARQLPAG